MKVDKNQVLAEKSVTFGDITKGLTSGTFCFSSDCLENVNAINTPGLENAAEMNLGYAPAFYKGLQDTISARKCVQLAFPVFRCRVSNECACSRKLESVSM